MIYSVQLEDEAILVAVVSASEYPQFAHTAARRGYGCVAEGLYSTSKLEYE